MNKKWMKVESVDFYRDQGLTLREACKYVGISVSSYYRWKKNMTVSVSELLAD